MAITSDYSERLSLTITYKYSNVIYVLKKSSYQSGWKLSSPNFFNYFVDLSIDVQWLHRQVMTWLYKSDTCTCMDCARDPYDDLLTQHLTCFLQSESTTIHFNTRSNSRQHRITFWWPKHVAKFKIDSLHIIYCPVKMSGQTTPRLGADWSETEVTRSNVWKWTYTDLRPWRHQPRFTLLRQFIKPQQ